MDQRPKLRAAIKPEQFITATLAGTADVPNGVTSRVIRGIAVLRTTAPGPPSRGRPGTRHSAQKFHTFRLTAHRAACPCVNGGRRLAALNPQA